MKREKVKSELDPDLLFQLVKSFRNWTKAVAEFVLNGLDWRVTGAQPEIVVRFFKEGRVPCLEIVDQGCGAAEKGRFYFTSLGKSLAREVGGMRGRKGSGSKGWIWHCREVVIETVPVPGTIYRVTLTVKKLLQWFFGAGVGDDAWEIIPKPAAHPIRSTGTRVILRGIGADNGMSYEGKPMVNPKETRDADRLIAELSECLPPNAHRFVRVVSEAGTHELQVRQTEGEPIIGEAAGVPGVGDMSWDIGVVVNRQTGLDYLRVGGLGTYISWQEFARLARRNPRLRTLLGQLDLFGDPKLSGYIEAAKLNDHRSTSSDSFDADLSEDEDLLEGMLITLIEQVLPGVREALKTDRKSTTSDGHTFLAALAGGIHQATGIVPTGTPVRKVKITRRRQTITLERGDTAEISIEVEPGVIAVWDDSVSGGSFSVKRGTKGTYTAGKTCGSFILIARNMADATQALYEVTVVIVEAIPFAFSRPVYRTDVNARVRVAIDERAIRHTSGDIVIRLCPNQSAGAPTDAKLDAGTKPYEGFVASGAQEGFLEIEAFDAKDPQRFQARAKVSIEKDFSKKGKETSPLDLEFIYDGHRYELAPSSYSGSPEALRQVSYLTPGKDVSTITLNLDNPALAGSDEVRGSMALWQIAMRVVERTQPELLIDQASQEAGAVFAELTRHRAT